MILAVVVFCLMMPVILLIAMAEKAKSAEQKRQWHAEHIDVSYRKPSLSEDRNVKFIRAVNKYVVNSMEGVTDIKVIGDYLRNVVTVYVWTKEGRQKLTLFKQYTDKGWEFSEETATEEPKSPKEDDKPKGDDFDEDDEAMVEVL